MPTQCGRAAGEALNRLSALTSEQQKDNHSCARGRRFLRRSSGSLWGFARCGSEGGETSGVTALPGNRVFRISPLYRTLMTGANGQATLYHGINFKPDRRVAFAVGAAAMAHEDFSKPPTAGTSPSDGMGLGCGGAAAALMMVPVIVVCYVVSKVASDGLAVVVFILGAGVVVSAIMSVSMSAKKAASDREGLTALGFSPDIFTSLRYGEYVALDKTTKRFAIKVGGRLYLKEFSDIVGVEVEQDGSAVERTNRGSQIDGAITGALVAGPLGMLVGGVSGSKRIEQKSHSITLNVYSRDFDSPNIKVSFLKNAAGALISSSEYLSARKLAQEWYGRFRAAM